MCLSMFYLKDAYMDIQMGDHVFHFFSLLKSYLGKCFKKKEKEENYTQLKKQ